MDTKTKREVSATLLKAGRRDLAQRFVHTVTAEDEPTLSALQKSLTALRKVEATYEAAYGETLKTLERVFDDAPMSTLHDGFKKAASRLKARTPGASSGLLKETQKAIDYANKNRKSLGW